MDKKEDWRREESSDSFQKMHKKCCLETEYFLSNFMFLLAIWSTDTINKNSIGV